VCCGRLCNDLADGLRVLGMSVLTKICSRSPVLNISASTRMLQASQDTQGVSK
jgi:hypothetical protein